VHELARPLRRGRVGQVRVAAQRPIGVAGRAQRLEAAGGTGAQRPGVGLAALLEPLLQRTGLPAVPDPDQLDRAARIQGGGQQPRASAGGLVGGGVVATGQVLWPADSQVGGELLE
jgi:hypothetical protein